MLKELICRYKVTLMVLGGWIWWVVEPFHAEDILSIFKESQRKNLWFCE